MAKTIPKRSQNHFHFLLLTFPIDRTKVMPRLMANNSDRLTPGVAIDPNPSPHLSAPTSVQEPISPGRPSPELLRASSKPSLTTMLVDIYEENKKLRKQLAIAESSNLDLVLRLPLRNTTNTAAAAPGHARAVPALRAKNGEARVLTRTELTAAIEENLAAKAAVAAEKAAHKARPRGAGKAPAHPRKQRRGQLISIDITDRGESSSSDDSDSDVEYE